MQFSYQTSIEQQKQAYHHMIKEIIPTIKVIVPCLC